MDNLSTLRKIKIESAFIVSMLVFIIIFISPDTLLFGTNINEDMVQISKYVSIIIAVILLLFAIIRKPVMDFKTSLIFSILSINLLLACFINGEPVYNYVYRLILIITAYLFTWLIERELFLGAFELFMRIIALSSIVIYIIYLAVPDILNILPKIINSNEIVYHNAVLSVIHATSNIRSYGIFREPGIFAIFLLFALYILLFEKANYKILYVFIYVIAIILTFSTTGYLLLGMMLLVYIIMKRDTNKANKTFLLIASLTALISMLILTDLLYSDSRVFNKLNTLTTGSAGARIDSFFMNFRILLDYPLFGAGAYKVSDLFLENSMKDNTNTFLGMFSSYGVIFSGIVLYSYYLFLKQKNNIIISISIFLLFFLMLSSESLLNNVVFYIIAFYGITAFDSITVHNRNIMDEIHRNNEIRLN